MALHPVVESVTARIIARSRPSRGAYLAHLEEEFGPSVALVAAGYNAGEGAVDRHRGVPPYRETRAYVERILRHVGQARHPYDSSVVSPSRMLRTLRLASQEDHET